MKRFYLFSFFILLLTACQNDPLESDEPTVAPAVARLSEASEPRAAGSIAVGRELPNPLSVWNMEEALGSIRQRETRGTPADGRIGGSIAEELMHFPQIRTSHYHVKITPKTLEELDLLEEDTTLLLRPVPYGYEILGEGLLPYEPTEFDPETGEVTLRAPIAPRYAIIPTYKTLPAGITYQVLDRLYIPEDIDPEHATRAGIPVPSKEFAAILTDQAIYKCGLKPMEEIRAQSNWNPSGCIRVYDTKLGKYVGVPSAKVYAFGNGKEDYTYTDRYGNFRIEKEFKGEVTYYIQWDSCDYKILNWSHGLAYYYGPTKQGEWRVDIRDGETRNIATINRAMSSHFFGSNIWDRVNDYKRGRRFRLYYRHEHHPKKAGYFHYTPINRYVAVYGKQSNDSFYQSENLLSTTFHELGHAAMYFRCARTSGLDYDDFDKKIRESWAKFIGWIMLNQEYRALGFEFTEQKAFNYDTGQPWPPTGGNTPRILPPNIVYFHVPDDFNSQKMNWNMYTSDAYYQTYTPIFIDLVDNSNQKEYYRVVEEDVSSVYPDDRLVVKFYEKLLDVLYASKNLSMLKANLLANKEALSITEDAIMDYFAFYGL